MNSIKLIKCWSIFIVVKSNITIFTIFEFKFNGDKNKALSQIKEKKYFEKYQGMGKEIYLFGVDFTDRNVGEWVVEKMHV